MYEDNTHTCITCNNQFTGIYCNQCGEKLIEPKERTFKHFAAQFFNSLTFADGKFLKSLQLLFIKPGFLPQQYVLGRRKVYIPPLSMFLIANLVYFILEPVDSFNTSFNSQVYGQFYWPVSQQLVEWKLALSGMTEEALASNYNLESGNISKLMLILVALFFAVPLNLMFLRKKELYFHDHLMLSLSFVSFILYGLLIILPYLLAVIIISLNLLGFGVSYNVNDTGISVLITSISLAYLILALKRFYREKYGWIFLKAIFLIIGFIAVMFLYRLLLFIVTLMLI